MNLARLAPLVLVAGLSACGRGCAGPPAEPVDAGTASQADDSPASANVPMGMPPAPGRGSRRTGLVGMAFHAAHDLKLSPDQSLALDQIEAALRASDQGATRAKLALQADVVAGIRAGKLDASTMRADYAALDAATNDHAQRQAQALDGLWAVLGPSQRADLALAVRTRLAAHALRPPAEPDEVADDWTARRLERLDDTLGLDEGQRRAVSGLLKKSALPSSDQLTARKDAAVARGDALLRAFARDPAFDARKLDDGGAANHEAGELIEKEVTFLGQLIMVLTPAQREKLAVSRERQPGPSE